MSGLRWSGLSITKKIMASALVALLPMMGIVAVSQNIMKQSLVQGAGLVLTLENRGAAQQINQYLRNQRAAFHGLTSDLVFGMAIEYDTLTELKGDLVKKLADTPGLSLVLLVDKSGKVLISSNDALGLAGKTIPGLENSFGQDMAVSFTTANPAQKEYPQVLRFSLPSKSSDGKVNGLLLAYVNWQPLQSIMDRTKQEFMESNLGDGRIFLHFPGSPFTQSLLNDIQRQWLADAESDQAEEVDKFFLVTSPLLDPTALQQGDTQTVNYGSFHLVSAVDDHDVYVQLDQMTKLSLMMALGGTVIVLLSTFGVAHTIIRPVREIQRVIGDMSQGHLTDRIAIPKDRDEVYEIAAGINALADSLSNTVKTVTMQSAAVSASVEELIKVGEGLTQDGGESNKIARQVVEDNRALVKEFAEVGTSVERASVNIDGIFEASQVLGNNISTIAAAAEQASQNVSTMAAAAEEMTANVVGVNHSLEEVQQSVGTVSGAVSEMTASLEQVRLRCASANKESAAADALANQTADVIDRLMKSAQEIGQVVDMINNIANQTNMLALNAAIESAGAGEAGKGFAVVANEVKELARQTGDATRLISKQIEGIRVNTKEVTGAVQAIAGKIGIINTANQEITSAVDEQGVSINHIARSMAGVTAATESVWRNATELERAAKEVARAAAEAAAGTTEIASSASAVVATSAEVSQKTQTLRGFMKTILDAAMRTGQTSQSVQDKMGNSYRVSRFMGGGVHHFNLLAGVLGQTATALREAQAGLDVGPPPFDIQQVKASHLVWLGSLEQAICHRTPLTPDQVATAATCPFGGWITAASGRADEALLRELSAAHSQFHEGVKRVVMAIPKDRDAATQQAEAALAEVEARRLAFFTLLDRVYMG